MLTLERLAVFPDRTRQALRHIVLMDECHCSNADRISENAPAISLPEWTPTLDPFIDAPAIRATHGHAEMAG
ncbi:MULTISPECIES: hypothetical protein [Pseudomonas]|jgi:hypothetical protein|uniref:Uncharacterized protein n=1 Tax=Pseudomonas canavaninivorans TaxID=2842348 RepID=A0ABX8QE12_PSECO|nr:MULTISPECIES: hypothetical protein [Pseudomonas]MBJ2345855.1 hypothetical protein [Pseudomonas canavaninivorans]MBL3540805.1 hypothetical protein [Pseudomonas sp. HB05]QXI53606.1 hypothetical protein KSS97_01210 [Pseudomonas alvandae]UVM72648.1 hypothetical protein LOY40_00245 [Pseudomonas canavaninivorans]